MAEGVNVNWEKQTTNKFSYFQELNNQPWFQIKNKTNINSSQKPFVLFVNRKDYVSGCDLPSTTEVHQSNKTIIRLLTEKWNLDDFRLIDMR